MPGDDEEDDTDDLENEFSFEMDSQRVTDAMLHGHMSYGGMYDLHRQHHHMMRQHHQATRFPLLTDGTADDVDDDVDTNHSHTIAVPPPPMNGGKRVHPLPYLESSLPGTSLVQSQIIKSIETIIKCGCLFNQ